MPRDTMGAMRAVITLAAFALLLTACGSDDDGTATPTTESTTSSPSTAPLTVSATCEPADPADVELVATGLTDDAVELRDAFTTTTDVGRWIAANVHDADGERLSSSDSWIIANDTVYAISSSAEDYSMWPRPSDGPALAGSDITTQLSDCIIAQVRARNLGDG